MGAPYEATPGASGADAILLAARAAWAFTGAHRLTYAHLAPDLRIAGVAPNFRALVTDVEPPLEGQTLADVLREFVGAEEALGAILAGHAPEYCLEFVNRPQADGSISYLTFLALPLDEGQPGAGLLLLIEDVTPTARVEQLLVQDRNELRLVQAELARANRELEDLTRFKSFVLSMAAHDLRSPLAAVLGYSELLLESLPPDARPEQREYLGAIQAQADRLTRLITDLLDVDQIEQGNLALTVVRCDLNPLVREVAGVLRATAARRKVALAVDLDEAPLEIHGDPERLRQVLHNLIDNAVKYTPAGGQVRVSARRHTDEAVLEVTDTGPGMSEAQAAQLFQLYYRTDQARQSGVVGTGLGLYVVKTLVEAHRGRVEARSRQGRGTTVTVRLAATAHRAQQA